MDVNPKSHAQTKRKKFQKRRDYRYGGVGGHSVHKNGEYHGDKFYGWHNGRWNENGTIERKFVNMPGKKAQLMKQLGMKLPFEEKLGLDFGSTVSLDKKKRWETIPEELEKMNLSAKAEWSEQGELRQAYGVEDDWTIDELLSAYDYQQKVDKKFQPQWVKDRHFYSMQKKQKQKKKNDLENWPKRLLKYERLHGVVSTRRQNVSTLRSRGLCSLTASWEHTPDIFLCHDHDYIQVEFKQPVRVVAVGTKGMFKSWRSDEPHQNYYVTKYKIQYKPQEGKYMGLGKFNGNSNALTEHINDIADPHTGKVGLVVTGIRIVPARGGFIGQKRLRVAIYGETVKLDSGEDIKFHEASLRTNKFEGTTVTISSEDRSKTENLPRKTKGFKISPEWTWSKPVKKKECQDALTVSSGGYVVTKAGGMPELAI